MTINMTKRTSSKVAWVQEVPDQFTVPRSPNPGDSKLYSKKNSQDIKEFAESTSAHGLKNAVSEKSSRFRRVAWFVAFLAALAFLGYQLGTCLVDYYRYPIQAQLVLKRMDSLKFPTVTICNLNLADATKAKDPDAVTHIFRVAKGGHWPAAYNKILDGMQHDDMYQPYLNQSYKDLVEGMSSTVDEVFSFCSWNGEMVACADMLVPVWTFVGKCFQLNSNASRALEATRAGFSGGFFATLRTSLSGHTVSGHNSYGYKALVHHMYDFPDVYSKGLMLSPGFSYHVSLQENTLKYLPHPYKAQGDMYCSEYESLNETDTDMMLRDNTGSSFSSVMACIFHRASARAAAICGCDMKNCTLYAQLSCFGPTFSRIYDQATKMDLLGCPIPCTIHTYQPIISQAAFPSPDLLALDTMMTGNSSEMDSDLYLGLSLFFEDLIMREKVHHPVYNSLSMMGMIGGNMGLLLGASLLTLAELLEFVLFLIWRLMPTAKDDTMEDFQKTGFS